LIIQFFDLSDNYAKLAFKIDAITKNIYNNINQIKLFHTMKKNSLFTLSLLLFISVLTNAQKFPYETYMSSNVTYLGLDFTHARMVDKYAFADAENVQGTLLYQWNHMVTSEPDKYDVPKYFGKPTLVINLKIMDDRNSKVDASTLIQDEYYTLKRNEVPQIVSTIDFGELEGLAVFFLVGSYNKVILNGAYFLVVYDIDNSEILYVKNYTAKPKGFGLRNFWAKTYYIILKQVHSDWKNKWPNGTY